MDDVETIKRKLLKAENELGELRQRKRTLVDTLNALGAAQDKARIALDTWAREGAPKDRARADQERLELAALCKKARDQARFQKELDGIEAKIKGTIEKLLKA